MVVKGLNSTKLNKACQMPQNSINYVRKEVPAVTLCKEIAALCLQAKLFPMSITSSMLLN